MRAQVLSHVRRAAIGIAALLSLLPTLSSVHGATVTYEHDNNRRLTRAVYSDGTIVEYEYDGNGNRTAAIVAVDATPPDVPAGLAAIPVSQSQIDISWSASTDNIGVTGYRLQRCTGANCTAFTQIATSTSTSYPDTGRSAGSTYRYRVSAYDAEGNESAFSSIVSATALDATAPSAPGTPSFSSITMSSATASWAAATDNIAVTGYRYRLNAGIWQTVGNVLSVNLMGLSAATTYSFEVSARDAANNLGATSSGTFTTPDTAAPSAPGAPAFSNLAQTSATASWTGAADNVAVTGYQYRLNAGTWQTLGNVLSVNLTGLSATTTYTFEVRARDAANNVGPASSGSFSISDETAPGAPGMPTFSSITVSSATASWTAATDNVGVTSYEYRLNTGAWQPLGNVLSVSLTGLSPATSYTFEVRAKDGANNIGAATSGAFTTPDAAAPSAPGTPVFSSLTMTSATASWTAATDNVAVTGYQYRLNAGTWQTLGNVLSVNLTGLSAATTYTFEVRARDAANNLGVPSSGGFTTPDTTPPGAPGTPTFSSITMTSATASWTAATDNVAVTGYRYRINGGVWQTLGNVTSVGLTGLAAATTYTIEVQARDAVGNWGSSASGAFTTPDTQAPTAPGAPTFSNVTMTSATASWSAASDNVGVTAYQYRLNGGGWQSLGNVTSVGLSGLSVGSNYTFEIQARDGAGNWGSASASTFMTSSPAITLLATDGGAMMGTVYYRLTAAGEIYKPNQSNTLAYAGDWLSPKTAMHLFEVMATQQSGSLCQSGTFNTWLPLTSTRQWSTTKTGAPPGSTRNCIFTITIRNTVTGATGSSSVTITAVSTG